MSVWRRLGSRSAPRWLLALVLGLGVLVAAPVLSRPVSASGPVTPGFRDQVVFAGLTKPTSVVFASDGRIFVAEKAGVIKEFDSVSDTTPTVVADLSGEVMSWWDRGLLGLALAPDFPADPSMYVLYTADETHLGDDDAKCRSTNNGGCVVQGRLARLRLSGNA